MILLRSNILRYYHFVRPTLSSIQSKTDLQSILQKRLIQNIKEVNHQKLHPYSFSQQLTQELLLASQSVEQIAQRTVKMSVINPKTQQHQIVQSKITQDLRKLQIQGYTFGLPFINSNDSLHHFSQKRGVPNFKELQQYQLNETTLLIFNLPENINEQDIKVSLKADDIKVTFNYCILGLVAYAKVQFKNGQSLKQSLEKVPSRKVNFGDRTATIRSQQDESKLTLGYRRLVINLEEGDNFQRFVVEFSKFGRVLHVEWPLQAYLNPTIEQVKQFYKDSKELYRINQIYLDGSVQSQYYPQVRAWQLKQDERQAQSFIEKAQKLKQSYEHRARFAKPINVYVGKEHQQVVKNKGYCVVTYSTYQQCQNYYFTHGSQRKMQLVGQKQQFQYDPLFKKQVLRQVDNQYLFGKKNEYIRKIEQKQKYHNPDQQGYSNVLDSNVTSRLQQKANQREYPESYDLINRILDKIYYKQAQENDEESTYFVKKLQQQNDYNEWEKYLRFMRQEKGKINRKSFDQLAEIELFGRVLPKDSSIERIIAEDTNYKRKRQNQLVEENNLSVDTKQIFGTKKYYRRQKERNNRIANQELGFQFDVEVEATEQDVVQQVISSDGDNIGKHGFSTRKPTAIYRKRNSEQEAHYHNRYCQFIRSTIYQYMGIFHDKIIEEVGDIKQTIINPYSLKWINGDDYFTEDDLTNALQFRRNFTKAQQELENYVYGSQYLKSSNLNVSHINANYTQIQSSAIQQLTDVGVVEQVKKVRGDNLQEKVKILNAQAAQFGEEYRIEQDNNQHLLVKIRKLQHLLPLDRVAHLQKFIENLTEQVTPVQSQIFDKFYQQMKENGVISDEVSDAFGIQKGKTINDLLAEVGAKYDISKKDLQMAQRAKTFSQSELKQDIDSQLSLEKSRSRKRKINSNSFAKDPSEIYVKDREGYYKVSRYRQI